VSGFLAYFFDGRILYIPVPHFEHLPFSARLPFFMVTSTTSTISVFVRHFTQYAISATAFTSSLKVHDHRDLQPFPLPSDADQRPSSEPGARPQNRNT